jgi:hypothetical protein
MAAARPIAPAMCGVPASNFHGSWLKVVFHVAAALPRRHRFEQRLAAVQYADARRSDHLVSGEAVEIAIQRLHVDDAVRHRLCAVE